MAILKLIPCPDKRHQAIEILNCVGGEARSSPGCTGASVFEQLSPEQAVLYVETWRSEEELCRHIQSGIYRWVLAAMELASAAPEICFHQISSTRGLDMVEALRGSGEQTPCM